MLGYDIYRGPINSNGTVIATTVATTYTDLNASNNGTDCYWIRAFDASRNTSVSSEPICATSTQSDSAAPVTIAAPAAGTYTSTQTVRLTCDDGFLDSGCKSTYYSFDSAATPATLYTGPITVATSSTLRFYSLDNANNIETVKSAGYVIETVTPPAGNGISFTSSTYQINENGAVAVITVARSGNVALAATVDYAVQQGGSATESQDYQTVSGTLNWAVNESASKSFQVPIYADNLAETDETVLLSLSNPSGTTILGGVIEATLTIHDSVCTSFIATSIAVNTTFTGCVLIGSYVYIDATAPATALLTITPGATLIFSSGAGLNANRNGAITAVGTKDKPITFTGTQKTRGYWKGIQLTNSNDNRNEFAFVTIEFAGDQVNGSGNIMLFGSNQSVKIRDSIIRGSSQYGFDFSNGSTISQFSNNVITDNSSGPGKIGSDAVAQLESSSRYTGNGGVIPTDFIHIVDNSIDTTTLPWPTLDAPYFMDGYFYINTNLQLSAGTTLLFSVNGGLNISNGGSLKALGTAEQPITFTAKNSDGNTWKGIQYTFSNSANNQLDHVVVEYGSGSGTNGEANLIVFGNSPNQISVKNSIFRNGLNYGVSFDTGTSIVAFSNNTITGNRLPIKLPAALVDKLENHAIYSGNSFLGNTEDIVDVLTDTLDSAAGLRWPNIGVDYRASGNLYIDGQVLIEPGITLAMAAGSYIWVSSSGVLVAEGTAELPIRITSSSIYSLLGGKPGDWAGIQFVNSTGNSFNHVTVEYGGGTGLNASANVVAYGNNTGSGLSVQNSTIQHSAGYGIWLSQESVLLSNIASSNSYNNNGLANVSP